MSAKNIISSIDGYQVSFDKIRFSVNTPDNTVKQKNPLAAQKTKEKVILNSCSGAFRPGELTAVMGASGAGKTSLLNVLAGHTDGGHTSGTIYANQQPVTGEQMRKASGFVFQDDVILQTMTTREAIYMSAKLRLGDAVSEEEKNRKVDEMLDLLNLRKCANTIIGSPTLKGVSGGERKRVAIAMEMLTDPAILMLDEPTSGLDSFTAHSVISLLRDLARTGRTIIATIHQPSSEVFFLFDSVLFMAEGDVMYQGPTSNVVSYFAAQGYPCPEHYNPADHVFMSVLNNQEGSFQSEKGETNQDRIARLLKAWKVSPECQVVARNMQNPPTKVLDTSKSRTKGTKFRTQLRFLFGRESKNALRNPLILRAKMAQTLILSLIIGCLYLKTKDKIGTAATQNRDGVLFFLCVNTVMSSAMSILSIFAGDKLVFAREHGSGYYSLPAFFFSKIATEMPSQIIFPWIMVTVVYWMVGLQAVAHKYFIAVGICILTSLCGFSLGVSLASFFSSLAVALAVTPVLLLPLMLFSGLFVNNDAMPVWLGWIKYISPMKWGFEALVKNEYSGLTLYDASGNPYSGATQITALGMDDGLYIWICAVVLGAIVLFLIGISYYALSNIVSKNDKNKKNCATAPGKNGQVVDGGPVTVPVEMQGVVVQDV